VWSIYRPGGGVVASSCFHLTDANEGEVPS
jgi:hypothetical protein